MSGSGEYKTALLDDLRHCGHWCSLLVILCLVRNILRQLYSRDEHLMALLSIPFFIQYGSVAFPSAARTLLYYIHPFFNVYMLLLAFCYQM